MGISNNTNTVNYEKASQPTPQAEPTREQIFEALKRLRQLGETLPAVDAVAVVRENRDSIPERIHQ